MARRARRGARGSGGRCRPTSRAAAPRAGRAGRRPRRGGRGAGKVIGPRRARARRRRPARPDSGPLAQVGGDARVVAQRLEQLARLGPVVPGGHLDERDALVAGDRARRRRAADARRRARARAASTTTAMIRMNRSSVSNRGTTWKATNPTTSPPASATITRASAVEKRSIRAARSLGPGRIALVGEEGREPFRVVAGGGAERDAGRRRSCRDGTRRRGARPRRSTTSRCGPGNAAPPATRTGRPERARRRGRSTPTPRARRAREPRVEPAGRPQVQRARPLAVARERGREAALGRRLEEHDLVTRQPVAVTHAAPGRRGCGSATSSAGSGAAPGQPFGELVLRPVELHRRPAHARQHERPAASRRRRRRPAPPGTGSNTSRPPGSGSSVGRLAPPRDDARAVPARGRARSSLPARRSGTATVPRAGARGRRRRRRVVDLPGQAGPRPHSSSRSGASPPEANPRRS